jgi:hypothetical protein
VQLAKNVWDSQAGHAKAHVIYSFGREDTLDRAELERLIISMKRYLVVYKDNNQ